MATNCVIPDLPLFYRDNKNKVVFIMEEAYYTTYFDYGKYDEFSDNERKHKIDYERKIRKSFYDFLTNLEITQITETEKKDKKGNIFLEKEQQEVKLGGFKLELDDPIYNETRDVELFKKTKSSFSSHFVGFITVKTSIDSQGNPILDKNNCPTKETWLLVSLPKFIDNITPDKKCIENCKHQCAKQLKISCDKKLRELQCVFKLYKNTLRHKDILFEESEKHEIGFAEKFLNFYIDYGLYHRSQKEYQTKKGKTVWGKTVKQQIPDMINDTPIYRKPIREKYISTDVDITAVQTCILSHLQNRFGYILGYEADIPDSYMNINDIIGNQSIIQQIQAEKTICFNDIQLKMLEMLEEYLSEDYQESMIFKEVYGVVEYENVFETVLSDYFGSQIEHSTRDDSETSLVDVSFKSFHKDIQGNKVQIDDCRNVATIDWRFKPTVKNQIVDTPLSNKNILIPDIIFEEQYNSVVLDAKYYLFKPIEENGKIRIANFPGNHDVFKQIAYQNLLEKIYQTNLSKEEQSKIRLYNAFIFPLFDSEKMSESQLYRYAGEVEYNGYKILLIVINFEKVIDTICTAKWKTNRRTQQIRNQQQLIELLQEITDYKTL